MPEEINRIACDHMSTLLFTPTASGIANLIQEGFSMSREHKAQIDQPLVTHSGDVMFDDASIIDALAERPLEYLLAEATAFIFEIVLDHHGNELLEVHLWLPTKLGLCLRWVADKQIDLCGSQELCIMSHIWLPVT